MAKQLSYLLRIGLCHDDEAAPVSVKNRKKNNISNINLTATTVEFSIALVLVEDGTLSRWPSSSRIFQGWHFVTMANLLSCLSRIERRTILAT